MKIGILFAALILLYHPSLISCTIWKESFPDPIEFTKSNDYSSEITPYLDLQDIKSIEFIGKNCKPFQYQSIKPIIEKGSGDNNFEFADCIEHVQLSLEAGTSVHLCQKTSLIILDNSSNLIAKLVLSNGIEKCKGLTALPGSQTNFLVNCEVKNGKETKLNFLIFSVRKNKEKSETSIIDIVKQAEYLPLDYKPAYYDSSRLITLQNGINKLEYTSFFINEKDENMVFFNYDFTGTDRLTINQYQHHTDIKRSDIAGLPLTKLEKIIAGSSGLKNTHFVTLNKDEDKYQIKRCSKLPKRPYIECDQSSINVNYKFVKEENFPTSVFSQKNEKFQDYSDIVIANKNSIYFTSINGNQSLQDNTFINPQGYLRTKKFTNFFNFGDRLFLTGNSEDNKPTLTEIWISTNSQNLSQKILDIEPSNGSAFILPKQNSETEFVYQNFGIDENSLNYGVIQPPGIKLDLEQMASNKEQETFKCTLKVELYNGEVEDKTVLNFRIVLKEGNEPLIWIGILSVLSFCGIFGVFMLGRMKRRKPERVRETTEQLDLDLVSSEYGQGTEDTDFSGSSNF